MGQIPTEIQAGDTVEWSELLTDYPASSWTLIYQLNGPTNITLTATADGDTHDFSVAASASADYSPGLYQFQKYVTDGTDSYTLDRGVVEILTDFRTNPAGYDPRSHVKIVLDALEATIEGRATKAQSSIQIAGRALSYLSPADLRKEWMNYKRLYANELAAEKVEQGLASGKKIVVRFSSDQ